MNRLEQIRITGLSHDGRGVARVAGKVVFVEGALAGETVEAECVKRQRRFDEFRLTRVLSASPDRIIPHCPLTGTCGGCNLQHLAATAQLQHKQQTVLELLQRQSGLVPEFTETAITSAPFHYRRRARLAVQLPRRGGAAAVGFRASSSNRIVSVDSCPVLAQPLADLPRQLQQLIAQMARPEVVGHIELSLSESAGGDLPVIYLRCVEVVDDLDKSGLRNFARNLGAFLALREGDSDMYYLHKPDEAGPRYQLPEFDLNMHFQPGDFLQGNAEVNRALVRRLVDWLDGVPRGPVLDAFSGLGNFSLPLARRGFDVTAVEAVASMVQRAAENATVNGITDVTFRVSDLMEISLPLPALPLVAAVLDPPRQGALRLVTELAAKTVPTIVYVSCQPSTLARDAAALAKAGYRLERLAVVDMFPQTGHIETLAKFTAVSRKRRKAD